MINAILQVNLPDQLRGRVMGLYGLTWELMPVAGLIAGALPNMPGRQQPLWWVAMFAPNMRRLEQ